MTDFVNNNCIVAISTPPGMGALAVIRLSGEGVFELVSSVFTKDLTTAKSHTIHYGFVKEGKETVDEVMISVFRAPKSFTTEDSVEISCHGSTYIQQRILELLIKKGAHLAKPGEFTMRAFLNGRIDLSQAEAVADLIASESTASHDLAIKQMRGGFSHEIEGLRQQLIEFAALIELELDFGEEDVEFANRADLKELVEKILRLVKNLMQSFHLGNVIKNGVTTVIVGRPNAGKSTLLNAFLNEERAIVSDIAGTTRDTIEEALNINGVLFKLIDTAGIRDAKDQIEALGVEKTKEKMRSSTLLLYVYDAGQLSLQEVEQDLQTIQSDNPIKVMVVANKIDALTEKQINEIPAEQYRVSAKTKTGVHEIKEALYHKVISNPEQMNTTIVTNLRHFEALQKTQSALQDVLNGMAINISSDLIAMDIRHALRHLGEITGSISTDDLLDNIFSNFCIGK
ncbi:MAG: tRNA uridine-5-carboxymethylaminomethyl(34) synthesis GTPase MnmE [Bacteroidetes bacterium]|nr:tRNA uridine-5-carboxymethylaminomethyl(34) synthesis GTPase MnmE [Bacteroidota bacterium]